MFDYDVGGKWLQLLKEIAPRVTRAASCVIQLYPKGSGNLAPSIPPSLGVAVSAVNIRDAGEIERAKISRKSLGLGPTHLPLIVDNIAQVDKRRVENEHL